ncbi:MAG: alkaline phosphatase D family protein [Bdellovibrionales bacterium]
MFQPMLPLTMVVLFGMQSPHAKERAQPEIKPVSAIQGLPSNIAFGSCANQNKPQPVLETVVKKKPDLFIYLGDNIYGDTRDIKSLKAKYAQLAAKPEFQALRRHVAVLSTWDDHDYGENDSGKEYPKKEESREIFLDFWKVPADSPRRKHPGIYGDYTFKKDGKTLQILLLDTRYFRDPLKRNPKNLPKNSPFKNDYQPDPDPNKSFLGKAQWQWLEERLKEPADLRIICSSIQFGHQYNGWESWTNLPAQHKKMIDLIKKTRANGVMFISGDVHWGEISKRDIPGAYPLHDVTASGITETWPTVEPNRYRQGEVVRDNHFGMINIDWQKNDPEITLQIVDRAGTIRVSRRIKASALTFSNKDQ